MIIHCNTTPAEFIAYLRDAAIRQNAKPQIIDAIDRLRENEDREAELEKVGAELDDANHDKRDLHEELQALVKAIDENLDPDTSPAIENALKIANLALERHSS